MRGRLLPIGLDHAQFQPEVTRESSVQLGTIEGREITAFWFLSDTRLRQGLLNRLLHHRKCCACSAGKGRQARGVVGAIEAEHGVLDGAESTYARLVPGRRTRIRHISCDWGAGCVKYLVQITALRCICGR